MGRGWEIDSEREKKKFGYIPDEDAPYVKRKKRPHAKKGDHKHRYRWFLVVDAKKYDDGTPYIWYSKHKVCSECRKSKKWDFIGSSHYADRRLRKTIREFLAKHPNIEVIGPYWSCHLTAGPDAARQLCEEEPCDARWILRQLKEDGVDIGCSGQDNPS